MPAPPASQTGSFHLDASLEEVIPLFTPEGERAWAAAWKPDLLSGREERGTVFRTQAHDGRDTTWIVIDYRPAEGCISYARLTKDLNIGLVDIACCASASGGTEVSVRYTLTGLSWQGSTFVRDFLERRRYGSMMEEWRSAISAALVGARKRAGDGA